MMVYTSLGELRLTGASPETTDRSRRTAHLQDGTEIIWGLRLNNPLLPDNNHFRKNWLPKRRDKT